MPDYLRGNNASGEKADSDAHRGRPVIVWKRAWRNKNRPPESPQCNAIFPQRAPMPGPRNAVPQILFQKKSVSGVGHRRAEPRAEFRRKYRCQLKSSLRVAHGAIFALISGHFLLSRAAKLRKHIKSVPLWPIGDSRPEP